MLMSFDICPTFLFDDLISAVMVYGYIFGWRRSVGLDLRRVFIYLISSCVFFFFLCGYGLNRFAFLTYIS